MSHPRVMWTVALASAVLALAIASLLGAFACNIRTHEFLREGLHRPMARVTDWDHAGLLLPLTGSAPFEQSAPWTSTRDDRPDHPPPVIRGGWIGGQSIAWAAKRTPPLAIAHALLSLTMVFLYLRYGKPKQTDWPGVKDVWPAVIVIGAWLSIFWPAIALLVWDFWYWLLLAPRPDHFSQADVEPFGVLGILFGAMFGYLFTIAAVTRAVIRRFHSGRPAECLQCTYPSVGEVGSICPECGRKQAASDAYALALSRRALRWSLSRKRWRIRAAQLLLILFLIGFPRTELIAGGVCPRHTFHSYHWRYADPVSYWVIRHVGLGWDGADAEDVIGPAEKRKPLKP